MKNKGTQQIWCARPQYIIRADHREQTTAQITIVNTNKKVTFTQDPSVQQDTQDITQDAITTEGNHY